MVETNSGLWLDQTLRTGACGTWWSASTSGGQSIGVLQLEPALAASAAAQQRVAAAVAAVRAGTQPGILRTTELVVDAKRAWLVVAAPPTPTLADLLRSSHALAPGVGAGIAVDVALALRGLHAVGLSHGDLTADTIVLTPGGSATLVEVGVLAALRDAHTDVDADVEVWASIAGQLAPLAAGAESELLSAASAMAASGDLATAVRRLADGAAELADFVARDSLTALLPTLAPAAPRIPAPRSTVDRLPGSVRLRFGPGVPEPAIEAARSTPPRRTARSRRSLRLLQAAVITVAVLLGAGGALFWFLALR